MRYWRPALEVEAMAIKNSEGTITGYYVDFLDGTGTRMMTLEEFGRKEFEPGSPPTKKGKWKARYLLTCATCHTQFQNAREDSLYCSNGCRSFAYRKRKESAEGIEPAQEFDHC